MTTLTQRFNWLINNSLSPVFIVFSILRYEKHRGQADHGCVVHFQAVFRFAFATQKNLPSFSRESIAFKIPKYIASDLLAFGPKLFKTFIFMHSGGKKMVESLTLHVIGNFF